MNLFNNLLVEFKSFFVVFDDVAVRLCSLIDIIILLMTQFKK